MNLGIGIGRNGMIAGSAALALAALALLAWAWIDGGVEPVHVISVAVPVPGASQ